jgi:hypothetical protein
LFADRKDVTQMFKSVTSKMVFATIFASLALFGCSNSDDESESSANFAAAGVILNYVPADSPYLMASIAPMPDDVMDKLEPNIDRILAAYEILLQELLVMANAEILADGDGDEEASRAAAVLGELSSLLSIDGLRGAGFSRESRSALYGNGMLPVLRIEVTDGALFEAALERIEESSGERMDVATISGSEVRFVTAEDVKLLISVMDKQVVISVAPASFDDDQLSTLLGFTAPASNITDSGKLQKIADEYGFNDYFIGYFDFAELANTFTGDASGLDADLIALMDDHDDMSDACRADIRSMAGIAPRMVMGYTAITTEQFGSKVVVELRSDIAAGLAKLTAPVPGLGSNPGGLMSFGMSLDIMAMREFVETQLDAIEADPYMCEDFSAMDEAVAQARVGLEQPMMPVVYDFRGFVAQIENIEGLNMATKAPPTSVDGQFLLAMENAPAMVSLGTMFSPELAGLNLQPDGQAVLLDLPQAQMMGGDVYVAMNDDAVAISVGDGAESKLGDMLTADTADNGTFLSFSMDAGRYYAFAGEAMAEAQGDDDHPMPLAIQEATQEIMLAMADMFDRMTVDVRLTEDGIVMEGVETLSE